MSGALVFAALKCKIPDPLTKLVLICVCDRFNEDLGYAWCSVDHIAEYCACSPRTVRYRLKELQVAGILEVEARDGNTNCYRIVHSRGAANGAGLHEVQLGAANGAAITSYELLTKKRRGGKTKLVDWKPDEADEKFCKELGLDVASIMADITGWNAQHGDDKAYKDCSAFFRNWCRRESKKKPMTVKSPGNSKNGTGAGWVPPQYKEFNKEEWAKLSDSMQAHYDNMRPTANPHYREKHGI